MGYSYCVNSASFGIDSRHFPDLMDHLLKWHTKMMADKNPIKWIDHQVCIDLLNEGDLMAYFVQWQYAVTINVTSGDIVNISHEGEKIGQEESLWEQIAPWVQDGSHIDCQGEDNDLWRWQWREGRVYTIEAEITYPDPIDNGFHIHPAAWMNDELNAARKANGWTEPENAGATAQPQIHKCDTQYALNAFRI